MRNQILIFYIQYWSHSIENVRITYSVLIKKKKNQEGNLYGVCVLGCVSSYLLFNESGLKNGPGDRRARFHVTFQSIYFRNFWIFFSKCEWYLRRKIFSKKSTFADPWSTHVDQIQHLSNSRNVKKAFSSRKWILDFWKSQLLLTFSRDLLPKYII